MHFFVFIVWLDEKKEKSFKNKSMFSSWYISHTITLLFSEIAQGETTLKNHFWLSKHFFFTKMVFASHFFFDIIDLKNILFHHQATNIYLDSQEGKSVFEPPFTNFWPTFTFYFFWNKKKKLWDGIPTVFTINYLVFPVYC